RGGPAGFLHVVTPTRLAFADYGGNRQLLTAGNLAVDDRVSLFLMDYPHRRRLKILGHARVADVREHPELLEGLAVEDGAEVERVVVIDVVSFDWNCPQHITERFTRAEVEAAVEPLYREIDRLRALVGEGGSQRPQGD
ncbi:MAG: pyridoxamine 5'-phosphate oxidase family protein, partial [Candidatus Binatia bacterium]